MIHVEHVKYEDKNAKVQLLEMALSMCGLGLSYAHVDLIDKVVKKLKEKGGNLDLKDATKLQQEWESKWGRYFQLKARVDALDAVSETGDSSA